MATRSLSLTPYLIALAAIPPLGHAPDFGSFSPGATVRIEAFGPKQLQIELTTTPAGLSLDTAVTSQLHQQLVVWTPARVTIDSAVRRLRVTVQGYGSVRLFFEDAAASGRPAAWGRDITLVRRADGQFRPVTRAHLLP